MGESSREARKKARRAALQTFILWGRRVGLVALAVGFVWASLEVRSRIRSDPRFRLAGWKLSLGDLPVWAPDELRDELESLSLCPSSAEGEGDLTVFTPSVLAQVRESLLASAWIRDVRTLRLEVPGIAGRHDAVGAVLSDLPGAGEEGARSGTAGSVDLELELRVPIALVAAGGAYYLTDREGVRMGPALDPCRARDMRLPAIVGGESRRERHPPTPGAAWEDRDVREGLEVARVLHDEGIAERYPRTPIEAIDIANIADRARPGECEVVLRAGSLRLGWGRSPISAGARTLPVPEILGNLGTVLAAPNRFSGFDLVCLYTKPLVGVRSISSQR